MKNLLVILLSFSCIGIGIFLTYFATRLLQVFKGGQMGKPWLFISTGALTFAIGAVLFAFRYLLPALTSFLGLSWGIIMVIGGVQIVLGMYIEHKNWTIKQ